MIRRKRWVRNAGPQLGLRCQETGGEPGFLNMGLARLDREGNVQAIREFSAAQLRQGAQFNTTAQRIYEMAVVAAPAELEVRLQLRQGTTILFDETIERGDWPLLASFRVTTR